MKEEIFLSALARTTGIGPLKLRKLYDFFGSAEALFKTGQEELEALGLSHSSVGKFVASRQRLDLKREEILLDRFDLTVLAISNPNYPPLLKEIVDAPLALFIKGEIKKVDHSALAVVGSRRMSNYGQQATEVIVSQLVAAGLTIVSGLAYGVDSLAHEIALKGGGRTLAVLAHGLDQIYPPSHKDLAERIIKNGALVSELPVGVPPQPFLFPRRNRLMSGLALGVLVVEAAEKSGSLVTAACAAEQNREVFAVPGSIFSSLSQGTGKLIQLGAKTVVSANDILCELRLEKQVQHPETPRVTLAGFEQTVHACLAFEARHADEIIRASGLEVAQVNSVLSLLVLKGLVKDLGNGFFMKSETSD